MSWETFPLEEFSVKRGGSVNPEKHSDETFELFSIPAYDKGFADVCLGQEIGSSKKCVQPNDVLLSRIVPHIRRGWVVGESKGFRQIASGEWIQFRSSEIFPQYLRYFLMSDPFHKQFMRTVSGVGGSLLRARPTEVYKIKVPLPPIAEQKRIAEILDAADALRVKRRDAIANLDTLLQSTFLTLFGDPITNPMGWQISTLKETKSLIQIGPFGSLLHKSDYVTGGIPLINPKHINEGAIFLGFDETISELKAKELKRYLLEDGDVIMGRRGEMGRCALVKIISTKLLCGSGSLFIRPNISVLTSLFLSKVISSQSMKLHLERVAWGVTMPNLNLSKIEALKIPLPPINLQKHFANIVKSIEKQKAQQRAHLAELDTLFASLQSRAFNGEL